MTVASCQLEVAESALGHPIWFPHNVDFRGRAYPVPPHFNHLAADPSRGLLLFDEAKPLGAEGLHWVKVRAVGCAECTPCPDCVGCADVFSVSGM